MVYCARRWGLSCCVVYWAFNVDKVRECHCYIIYIKILFSNNSFLPLACAEFDDSLPFSGASSIPLCYVLFPATLPHQLFFLPLSSHLAVYFLVCLSILLFPNSYIILLGILFSSILCTCPNQRNRFNLIFSNNCRSKIIWSYNFLDDDVWY